MKSGLVSLILLAVFLIPAPAEASKLKSIAKKAGVVCMTFCRLPLNIGAGIGASLYFTYIDMLWKFDAIDDE